MSRPDAFVPVAVTRRSDLDESAHFGAIVALDSNGSMQLAVGDPTVTIYPRSANKPIQAVAMARAGLDLPDDQLAVVCASHDGTPTHLAAVRAVLASAGLDESLLANTPDLPLDRAAAEAALRAGGGRTALQMNCSGKHAGMLATCVLHGWATDDYLRPTHPVQDRIAHTITELAGEAPAHIGVDGCGAPAHALSLVGLARAFRAIAVGHAGSAEHRVWRAMTRYPAMVGGERRDVTQFMRAAPGLMVKDGAEGVCAAAMPDGRAVAIKIADGANRARPAVLLAALTMMGIDASAAAPLVVEPILGHGHPVGEVRALPELWR